MKFSRFLPEESFSFVHLLLEYNILLTDSGAPGPPPAWGARWVPRCGAAAQAEGLPRRLCRPLRHGRRPAAGVPEPYPRSLAEDRVGRVRAHPPDPFDVLEQAGDQTPDLKVSCKVEWDGEDL